MLDKAQDWKNLPLAAKYRLRWKMQARPEQVTPPGDWNYWVILAGRGWGKSRTGAEDIAYYGVNNPGSRIAIVAPTYAAGRDTCIEGESGLISCLPPDMVGSNWNRSLGELKLTNGTIYNLFTSEKPDALRGPQFHRAWCDELAQFNDIDYTFDMLQMCLRLGKHPQVVITTTPLPLDLIRKLIADPKSYVTTGSTYDNKANLAETFISKVLAKYEGTRLGEQELYAKILDDVAGALWNREWINKNRVSSGETPDEIAKRCIRIVVAIDPATTSTKESDLTGLVAVGIDEAGHGYVLADETCKESPKIWATKAIRLLQRFNGDRIIGETNNGGDMVEYTIRSIDDTIPFKKVTASKGKFVRAEPIASLYEQNRISHVGKFELLENEMCMFTIENILKNSPNRCDALVWGFSELYANSLVYGALEYIKGEHTADMVTAGAVPSVEAAVTKVMTGKFTKPGIASNTTKCPECQSTAICKIAGQMHCNSCAHQWGPGVIHDFLVKQPRLQYLMNR